MATQGTDNLVIVDNMPSVEKLWNGRYRLEFFCKIQNPNEGWYSDSIDKWLPSFGALQDADFAGEGWSARDGEAYPDMRLVKCEAKYIAPSETHLVTLTYETLTASWVAEKDEDIDYELNGLQRVSRTFVALPETSYTKVVGTDTITVGGDALTLGAFKIEETDATWSLTETWLESGELSRSENLESGNESISITNIGGCPTAPAGYTAVNQEERDTQGFPTCSVTFYKDNSVLSRSNDYVGSQLAETIEVFNPTAEPVPTNGGVLANESVSNVDGIPTTRYTFLVPSVLSESTDNVGSQLAKVIEAFNEIPATPSGYVLANEQESDVEGIPTKRYTFLRSSVLSESTDIVGSQEAKVIESFNETPATPAGYVLARTDVSDFEGIPTRRYTFLKPSTLSGSEDFVGSQLAKVIEAFDEIPLTPAGYSLASKQVSDFDGIKTNRYTFLKDDVQLSESADKVGSQLATSQQWFNPTEDKTLSEYSLASKNVGDFEGIETVDYRFLKDNVELSRSEDKVGSQLAITTEVFNPTIDPTEALYSIARTEVSDVDGIPTKRFTFLKDDVQLSLAEDKVGSQLSISQQWFNPAEDKTEADYSLASKNTSDFGGIPTVEFRFLKDNVVLSVSEDKVGSQLAVTNEVFNPDVEAISGIDASGTALDGYIEADRTKSDFEGIPTIRVRFLKDNIKLSESEDKVGSQLAKVEEWFNPTDEPTITDYVIANVRKSDVGGIPTERYTFLKPSILSVSQQFIGGSATVQVQAFDKTSAEVDTALSEVTASHVLISEGESDYEGIKTSTYQYQLDESFTEDYELNGLKRISLIELSATNFTAQTVGDDTGSPAPGLYLGSQSIDNGGAIKVRESEWIEAGKLSTRRENESDGIYKVTNSYLVEVPAGEEAVGPVVVRTEDNVGGLKTITEIELQDAAGDTIAGGSPIASVGTLYPFTYPGTVSISDTSLAGTGTTYNFQAKDFKLTPPCQSKIQATVKTSFVNNTTIVYTSSNGLWFPREWAEGSSKGIGWNYAPFSISNGFRGYRTDGEILSYSGNALDGDVGNTWDMLSGKRLYNGTGYAIEISGGPVDPVGNNYTLDYTVDLAFDDVSGVQYYKHTEVVATIPTQ